ncbi:HupE/UreJ family protein [Pelagicoccus albus]|uniref:HupE/UreJ family protein n=1 Tax=Pelagicoccus albus TaxID=415222 RepID=A0A7X1B957_9BACT|nr:HupE/UreJ family protein [Pelagicoccus albus]MBC2607976.1 HupE/UreJ family protein [Pelagicoccus albus]
MIQRYFALACLAACTCLPAKLFAHATGETYLFLEFLESSIRGRVEIKLDDLNEKLGVDAMQNGKASEKIIVDTAPQITDYIKENLSIAPRGGEPYPLNFHTTKLFDAEGGWAQYEFNIPADPVPPYLDLKLTMLYDGDTMHRDIVVTEKGVWPSEDYEMNISMVFSRNNSEQILDVFNPPSVQRARDMIWQGILHIWIGIDHILFLVALALPIVLVKKENKWQPAQGLKKTLVSLLKIVTVFTVAHSITLALASLGFVQLPSRLVESIIALSIVLVAVNNLLGRAAKVSLTITFLLGLFHGLGFASVMADLPFRVSELTPFLKIIIAFNVGVEIGQLAILLVLFPVIYVLRTSSVYLPVALKGGSCALILIAGYWFIERAFAL